MKHVERLMRNLKFKCTDKNANKTRKRLVTKSVRPLIRPRFSIELFLAKKEKVNGKPAPKAKPLKMANTVVCSNEGSNGICSAKLIIAIPNHK
jgi:hypothetical protein